MKAKAVRTIKLLVVSLCTLLACSIAIGQDATHSKEVAEQEARVPKPPRSVADVFKLLDQYQPEPQRIKRIISEADASPQVGLSERELCLFYQNRSLAATTLGRLKQAEDDAIKAIEYTSKDDKNLISDSYSAASAAAMGAGQPLQSIEYMQRGLDLMKQIREPTAGFLLGASRNQLSAYFALGDTEGAEKANAQLSAAFAEVQSYKKGWPEWQYHWTQNYRVGRGVYFLGIGKPLEAEYEFLRANEAVENQKTRLESGEFSGSSRRPQQAATIAANREQILRLLGRATLGQGKPSLAEYYYREALKISLVEQSRGSPRVA
ncbi:MAG: hypothetical protein ACKOD7_06255, partial [Polynucleobacter victoriensis]